MGLVGDRTENVSGTVGDRMERERRGLSEDCNWALVGDWVENVWISLSATIGHLSETGRRTYGSLGALQLGTCRRLGGERMDLSERYDAAMSGKRKVNTDVNSLHYLGCWVIRGSESTS